MYGTKVKVPFKLLLISIFFNLISIVAGGSNENKSMIHFINNLNVKSDFLEKFIFLEKNFLTYFSDYGR
jgi:hypothetical protein